MKKIHKLMVGVIAVFSILILIYIGYSKLNTNMESHNFSLYDRLVHASKSEKEDLLEIEKDQCYLVIDKIGNESIKESFENQFKGTLSILVPNETGEDDSNLSHDLVIDAFVTLGTYNQKPEILSVDDYTLSYVDNDLANFVDSSVTYYIYSENNTIILYAKEDSDKEVNMAYQVDLMRLFSGNKKSQTVQDNLDMTSQFIVKSLGKDSDVFMTYDWPSDEEKTLLKKGKRMGIFKISFKEGIVWEGLVTIGYNETNKIVINQVIADKTYIINENNEKHIFLSDKGEFHSVSFYQDEKESKILLNQTYIDDLDKIHRVKDEYHIDLDNLFQK